MNLYELKVYRISKIIGETIENTATIVEFIQPDDKSFLFKTKTKIQ